MPVSNLARDLESSPKPGGQQEQKHMSLTSVQHSVISCLSEGMHG